MNNRDYRIIRKILEEIEVIQDMIKGYDNLSFIEDERTKRASCMTLINIGELVKNLTDDFKNQYNHVPWRGIAGMRDITAHKYQALKMGDVWVTLQEDIPLLKHNLLNILENSQDETGE